jgi:hypoxanthine phosphoribosyltransferase
MHNRRGLGELIITPDKIENRVREISNQINIDYKDKTIHLCIVLHGAMVFASDLIRKIEQDVICSYALLKSYEGAKSKRIRHTGVIKNYGPKSLRTATLLDKTPKRAELIKLDYVGFFIKDQFLVGYGMDYNSKYRHLPGLYELQTP